MGLCSTEPRWQNLYGRFIQLAKQHVSRQMLLSLIPLVVWFSLFQLGQFIPADYKPSISVNALPWLEENLFGGQVYLMVPEIHSIPFFDLFAALGYALHFVAPWTFGIYLWRTNGRHFAFLWCLGWLNALAVICQTIFPTAPPWYLQKYGRTPPTYDIKGDPAGLSYADEYLNMKFFYNIYTNSPVVFGSFPSLHAAWPMMIAVFSPKGTLMAKVSWFYVVWIWWAAMYLRHHFFVDCVGGALFVLAALNISRIISSVHGCLFGIPESQRTRFIELEDVIVVGTNNSNNANHKKAFDM